MPDQSTALTTGEANSSGYLAAILTAAHDPSVDATKLETLANLAIKLQDRERETDFNRALNAAIQQMPVITKDGRIMIPPKDGRPAREQGRFARFEDIYRVVRPILEAHNLAIRFEVGESNQSITVRPILSHANGFTERGEAMRIPPDTSGSKNAAQAVGSAVSYGKRYTMCAMLMIITEGEDNDGRGAVASLPFEREQTVLTEAQAAHEAGHYLGWFTNQSPKDRAYLIESGKHEEFGGQTALPRRTPPPPPPPPPPPADERPTPTGNRLERATTWANNFKAEVRACRSVGSVDALEAEQSPTLKTLEKDFPDLHREIKRAIDDKVASF